MKITVIGGGPAGLGAAIHLRRHSDADVHVLERAAENETPGLGVALLSFARDELRLIGLGDFVDDPASGVMISRTSRVFAANAGEAPLEQVRDHDIEYWGVRRASLVARLREAARAEGVIVHYGVDVTPARIRSEGASSALLIGADGAGSAVRTTYADEFGATVTDATSRYAWLELSGTLDHFVFGYIQLPGHGLVRITAYPHAPDACSAIITHSEGMTAFFDEPAMVAADGSLSATALATLNELFAPGMGGRVLSGSARWRRFHATRCAHAATGNVAILGDAYATVHYETGWGTSAALQGARIFGHILDHEMSHGGTIVGGLALYSRKTAEITANLVATTARVMRDVDAQGTQFAEAGPAGFLELATP